MRPLFFLILVIIMPNNRNVILLSELVATSTVAEQL